jgi:hypothetical protein
MLEFWIFPPPKASMALPPGFAGRSSIQSQNGVKI